MCGYNKYGLPKFESDLGPTVRKRNEKDDFGQIFPHTKTPAKSDSTSRSNIGTFISSTVGVQKD
jgi:hypothetical protein